MKCPKCKADNPDDSQFCRKCATPLTKIPATLTSTPPEKEKDEKSTLDFPPGQYFGKRYQIIEEIGRGGMGRVYKAVDKELNRIVALKMIKSERISQPGIVKRFKKEIKLASEITHENVCRMHDLGEAEGIKCISMQYIKGQNLREFIKTAKRLSVETAINITEQICQALAAAHKKGVIHRDLKPQNIMLDGEGNAYVMDFGIAKSLDAEEVTKLGVVIGTPHYMSPEQAEGKAADTRSDIYSLGCILYEMLIGKPPFEADTASALIHKHITEAPKSPSKVNPQIPKGLEEIIFKCLEKAPEKRFQSADEIIKVIDKAKPEVISVAEPAKARKNSIAVLPFADMSPQKDQEYFCDGISEELINALNKVEGLLVASRTSAFQFKGKGYNIQEIGKELKVQTVLEGSVRKAGNKLRIAAQLINAEDGYHLWSERYDREMDDVFAIQDEISLAIVDKLKVKLLVKEKDALLKRYTENLDAFNLYLKGRYFWNRRYEVGLKKALDCFQQAIEKDPAYTLAYTGIADCYNILGFYNYIHPNKAFPIAIATAEKALQMDDTLAEAHNSLAWSRFYYDSDWSAAEREYKRAIELNPNYATAHSWYAIYLGAMGRHEESIAEAKKAQELDPLSLIVNVVPAWVSYFARQHDKAIEEIKKALELDPNFIVAIYQLGLYYSAKAMHKEAIIQFQKAVDLSGGEESLILSLLGYGYSRSGNRAESQKVLDKLFKLSKHKYVAASFIAISYGEIGQKDKAFEFLEKAYKEHENWMSLLKVEPFFDSLRSDPRFKALLKKMNLE